MLRGSHSLHELKSEEPKETDRNKYDNSKALTLEMDVVGNEGSNPQPESFTDAQNSHVCLVLKPIMPRNGVVSSVTSDK